MNTRVQVSSVAAASISYPVSSSNAPFFHTQRQASARRISTPIPLPASPAKPRRNKEALASRIQRTLTWLSVTPIIWQSSALKRLMLGFWLGMVQSRKTHLNAILDMNASSKHPNPRVRKATPTRKVQKATPARKVRSPRKIQRRKVPKVATVVVTILLCSLMTQFARRSTAIRRTDFERGEFKEPEQFSRISDVCVFLSNVIIWSCKRLLAC